MGAETQLFISYAKPYKKVVSSTLSRWLVAALKMAGVDTDQFKTPFNKRCSNFSFIKAGVAMRDILATAGWASNSTFSRFYHRPSANSNMARALLASATKSPID